MHIQITLAISFIVVMLFSIRVLRKTSGTSLLAWHAVAFALVFDPASYFIEFINYNFPSLDVPFIAYYDDTVAERIQISLILVNVVVLVFLLLLNQKSSPKSVDKNNILQLAPGVPPYFYIGLPLVLFGFLSYLTTPMAQVILNAGIQSFGNYSAYYEMRYQASLASMSLVQLYLHYISLITVLPLITVYCLQRAILERSKYWLIWWLVFLGGWLIVSLLLLAKFNIVNVFVTNVIVGLMTVWLKPGSKKPYVIWAIVGSILIFLIVNLVYQILGASEDSLTSLLLLFERFVAVPVNTTWNHFVVFPDLHPFTAYNSSHFLNIVLGFGLPGTDNMLPYQIVSYILVGHSFNMNTGFLGSAWSEMGYIGVIQGAVLIFGIFFLWDQYLFRIKNTIPLPALIGFFLGKIWNIHNNDLMFMLISGGLLFAPPLYFLLFTRELNIKPVRMTLHRSSKLVLQGVPNIRQNYSKGLPKP